MKYAIAAVAVVAALAGGAIAQTTPAPEGATTIPLTPPAPVPPSTCPAYPATPTLPEASTLKNQKQINAGTDVVNAWITQYQSVGTCRREEVGRLDAQLQARVAEFKDGNAKAMAVRDQWATTVDTLSAAQKKKK